MNDQDNQPLNKKKEYGSIEEESIEKILLKEVQIGEKICKCNYGFIAFGKRKKQIKFIQ